EQIELEKHEFKTKRFKALGFHPQKEIPANRLLPYADQLDKESNEMLISIKNHLAKAVAQRDFRPGVTVVFQKLSNYIKLYGMKFSKEDHIKFIKLLLQLIEIPSIEPVRLNRYFTLLSQLLRKSSWLSPDDIEIDWKPLYKLSEIYIKKNSSKDELYRYFSVGCYVPYWVSTEMSSRLSMLFLESYKEDNPQKFYKVFETLDTNLQCIIQQCSPYFSKTATQEILAEMFPKLSPLDTGKSCDALGMLSMFLNTGNNYELWFFDCMDLWNAYHNPQWNYDIMNLVAMVANENVGLIDWEPYIPTMFTRILRSLNLPVWFKSMRSGRGTTLWSTSVALWIASTLGPKSSSQKYLTKFIGTIESYLHPANSGKWVTSISDIIVQLTKYFTERLIRERYRKHPWKRETADEHKLTEKCIDEFVECLKPVAFQAMYSRVTTADVGKIFKYLADLRPELIIPGVIDRVYTTLDSLTEPHKMTAALQCLISVSRALCAGHNGYTVGKTHVVPILFLTLPGIDPNDFRKTSITLEFLTSFALLVPIIDCSKAGQYYDDLTEDEIIVCDQTAEFETFVLQYLDKVFVFIEASSQDVIRMESDQESLKSRLENIAESVLQSSTHGILGQCSTEIKLSATRKLVDFVKTHLFEPRVSAHLVASLIRVFCRVAGAEMRKQFVPYLITTMHSYMDEHDDIAEIDKQSDELLYYIILLASVVRGDPKEVLQFVPDLIPIIDKLSKFKCKVANRYSNAVLTNVLSNVSTLQTIDVRSCPESFEKPLSEFLPVRHWAYKSETPIKWYVPDEEARQCCEMVIHRYLVPTLQQFEAYCNGQISLSKDDVLRDTSTVLALLKCANFLPNWTDEPALNCNDSEGARLHLNIMVGFEDKAVRMPDGSNVRKAVIKTFTKLQEKVLRESEDDIKSLKMITLLWERVHMRKHHNLAYESQIKSYKSLKAFQEYNLTKRRRDIRAIMATRVLVQQDCRDELSLPQFTQTHKIVMENLLKLSTAHYSVVRATAQVRVLSMLNIYPYSYKFILDDVESYLALDSNQNHESFKGILYVIGGTRRGRLVVRNNLEAVGKIWLALLKTNLSEKPSVVRLLEMIIDAIKAEFPTLSIELHIPDSCVDAALQLATDKSIVTVDEIEEGKRLLEQRNAHQLKMYYDTLNSILEITHNNSLHWRYGLIASNMIMSLVHPFVKYPAEVIRYSVHNLINESIEERKIATQTVRHILKQQKAEHIKIPIDPFEKAGVAKPTGTLKPGIRDDNRWLLYDIDTVPRNQSQWDEPKYLHKTEGFFGWSTSLSIYAPSDQQPPINRHRDQMSVPERIIFDFFSVESNFDKLIAFWSLEERKNDEKFSRSRCFLIKGLVAMFGEAFTDVLCGHIQRLIDIKDAESNHRCAAELMAGLMKGLKHWPYDQTERMYGKLQSLIRSALSNITVETDIFWGTCFATAAENFDPRRQYWLHEVLLEEPVRETTSFVDCSRIYCLQGPFNQHVWRMPSVSRRLYQYLRPYLDHPFQNVRERIGSILINICEADIPFIGANDPECPRIETVIHEILSKVQILSGGMQKARSGEQSSEEDTEFDKAVRLFKTACQWLVGSINRNTNGNISVYFELLPFACLLERCEQDIELGDSCSSLLAMISQALTLSNCMGFALQKIGEVSLMSSWSARLAVIDVLQVLVFNNMSIVLSRDEWVAEVQTIVLRLLEDSVLEVREKAAQVLGGLLHCSFLPATDKLLELFKKKCRTKVIKSSSRRLLGNCSVEASKSGNLVLIENQDAESSVRIRHMGVLGLCAFISAYPYDIPDFMPDVFEHLGAHLNDPQPIPATIRKTVGDFKRTHHDNWATHQLKFSENQLAVLSDLTIPPSYYA
ncbi:Proteasome activator complex subunit 4, partial [Pseudolycoriella hygida]